MLTEAQRHQVYLAYNSMRKAQQQLHQLTLEYYKPGTPIHYRYQGHFLDGKVVTVTGIPGSTGLMVKSDSSGKRYQIGLASLYELRALYPSLWPAEEGDK